VNEMDPLYPDTASITSALGGLVPDELDLPGLSPELVSALAANRLELASTELPPPPADLVARWDAALAALPPLVAAQPVPAPVRRLSGRRAARWVGGWPPPRRSRRWLCLRCPAPPSRHPFPTRCRHSPVPWR